MVPFENTGTVFVPPAATVVLNVVIDESDTKVLVPAPATTGSGSVATVYTVEAVVILVISTPKALLSWLKNKRKMLEYWS